MPILLAQPQNGRLDSRIGPADQRKYERVLDGKDWENPYITVRRDGVEVDSGGLVGGTTTVAVADLRATLVGLPVASWPYGRVVAVAEISLRAADGGDDARIDKNLELTLVVLKELEITAERWPGI